MTFSRDGKHVYATGGGGDNIIEFTVSAGRLVSPVSVAIPSLATQVPADPVSGGAYGYPHGIAATPDGKSLVVVDTYDSTIELFTLAADGTPKLTAQQLLPGAVPGQAPLAYLYEVAVSPNSSYAYVTAEGTGSVYTVVPLAALAWPDVTTQTVPQTTNVQQLGQLVAAVARRRHGHADRPVSTTPPTSLSRPDGSTLAISRHQLRQRRARLGDRWSPCSTGPRRPWCRGLGRPARRRRSSVRRRMRWRGRLMGSICTPVWRVMMLMR